MCCANLKIDAKKVKFALICPKSDSNKNNIFFYLVYLRTNQFKKNQLWQK